MQQLDLTLPETTQSAANQAQTKRPWKLIAQQTVRFMRREGWTLYQCSQHFGCSAAMLTRYCESSGYLLPEAPDERIVRECSGCGKRIVGNRFTRLCRDPCGGYGEDYRAAKHAQLPRRR